MSTQVMSNLFLNQNKYFRRWVRNAILDSNTINYDMKLDAFIILDESIESPIGIGSDTFFIDEIFVLKVWYVFMTRQLKYDIFIQISIFNFQFATMVGTFSLFLIDTKRKSEIEWVCNYYSVRYVDISKYIHFRN